MNNTFQFTFLNIESQLQLAIDQGYTFITCLDYYRSKDFLEPKSIVLRVDIDGSVKKADRLRIVFKKLGVKATFFVRLHAPEYNPFSFEKEMFCDIKSNNLKTTVFTKVDSLKEEMKFAFKDFRSDANRKLNNKKWFKTLQDYGSKLNEPIAELYIYAFLSERSNDFHKFYMEDIQSNSYYDDLLNRLTQRYPNSTYTKQFRLELNSDKYIVSENSGSYKFNWNYVFWAFLLISMLLNIYFWLSFKKTKRTSNALENLTKQEQNILTLILENKSNKEIAEALFVSVSTIKTHVNNLFKKLNVQSREEIKKLNNR